MDKKKKLAGLIIATKLGKKPEGEEIESTEEEISDKEVIAQEFLDAIEAKDPKELVSTLKALIEACSSSEEDEE